MILKLFDERWEECPYGISTINDIREAIKAHHLRTHQLPIHVVVTEPHCETMFRIVESTNAMNINHCEAIYRRHLSYLHVITP